MPKPLRYERKDDYSNRFMRDEAMRREYPNPSQRYAVAISEWKQCRSRPPKACACVGRGNSEERRSYNGEPYRALGAALCGPYYRSPGVNNGGS